MLTEREVALCRLGQTPLARLIQWRGLAASFEQVRVREDLLLLRNLRVECRPVPAQQLLQLESATSVSDLPD